MCVCMCVHAYMYVYMYVCTHLYVYVRSCMLDLLLTTILSKVNYGPSASPKFILRKREGKEKEKKKRKEKKKELAPIVPAGDRTVLYRAVLVH
ncbi:hypothetical protein B9Z19DRAFT_1085993 [Tuber borchii]|uniref:Uncharacterized protein n=1 Tax=Tuber borchii TaxID=42251 RepID=A0A2T6ZQ34_TUBBO|nr:hypothetical protein B9Z19DRAFT_1085993 [Tuber borchii]